MINIFRRLFGNKHIDRPSRDVPALAAVVAVPSVHVVKTTGPSLSHLGGRPNLPSGVSWPEHNGKKLGFLARLSLSEFQRTQPTDWLPASGALLFFYDMEKQPWGFDPKDRGSSVVLLVPDLPHAISQIDSSLDGDVPHRNASFQRISVLPAWERESVRALQLSNKESAWFDELRDAVFHEQPKHQISGCAYPIQGDGMELECQLVSHGLYCGDATGYEDQRTKQLLPGAANWQLLFQMDSDEELGVMWGDCGIIYFWIEEQAARRGDFSNAWLVLQCS